MLKIALGVTVGILFAVFIMAFAFIESVDHIYEHPEILEQQRQQVAQRSARTIIQKVFNSQSNPVFTPLKIVPMPSQFNNPPVDSFKPQLQIPKQHIDIVRENGNKAVMRASSEIADFKAQYKKPEECYDMQDSATRIRCANDFIRARKLYEASRE